MKISGQLLKKIILEEVTKILEGDADKVAQGIEKSSGFERKIAAINTQKELDQLMQFVVSKLDPSKITPEMMKKTLRKIYTNLK